jgi:hypothetical protein
MMLVNINISKLHKNSMELEHEVIMQDAAV